MNDVGSWDCFVFHGLEVCKLGERGSETSGVCVPDIMAHLITTLDTHQKHPVGPEKA